MRRCLPPPAVRAGRAALRHAEVPVPDRLYTPGPVEIPERILKALSRRPPHHRSEEFLSLFRDVSERVERVFGTNGRVVILAASGTGGMEAAAVSFARRDEPITALTAGKFGDRWIKILQAYGYAPEVVKAEWGEAIPPDSLASALKGRQGGCVFLTHSETSTATLHDVRALAAVAREHGAMVIADVITSLGVHELRQDDFGIDVAVAGSQKGLMLPPGLALVGLGPRAIAQLEERGPESPAFYLDLKRAAASAAQGDTPFTPAVSLVLALDEGIRMIEDVGLREVWRRHASIGLALRTGATAAGFTVFSKSPADSVTALVPPDGLDAGKVIKAVRAARHFMLAGGQDHLKGKIVRVGHMGLAYDVSDAVAVSDALEEAVLSLGATGVRGRAADGARSVIAAGAVRLAETIT
jgi:aspartate aminotransferase-like enzyme